MKQKKIKLAVFDIDGTIFRSSLVLELVQGLIESGIFPKSARNEMRDAHIAWLERKGDYGQYIRDVVKVYVSYHAGIRVKDIEDVAHHILQEHRDRVYRYTRDLVHSLKKKKYHLVAISGSPQFIVAPFAEYFGFDIAFGGVSEIKDGKFTGRRFNGQRFTKDKWNVQTKKQTFTEYIESKGLNVDYKNSVAVGDTEADIPLLQLVGKPIAFNPNSELAKTAKKNKWTIVVERKDVVYDASKSGILRTGL